MSETLFGLPEDTIKRALEAYAERMAAEGSRSSIPRPRTVLQHRPYFQQYKELSSKLDFINSMYPTFEESNEPQNRKKRRRTCETPSFQDLITPNQINVGLAGRYPSPNSTTDFSRWPQNFTFQSSGLNESVHGFESRTSYSTKIKNHNQLSRRSNFGTQKNLRNAGLLALDGDSAGNQMKIVGKCADFSKEIEDAISRIESLIPSLQELVKSVHEPKEKSDGKSDLPSYSNLLNSFGPEKDLLIGMKELGLTDNLGALGESAVGQKASQMTRKGIIPNPPLVNWSKSVKYVNDGFKSDDGRNLANVRKTQRTVDDPIKQLSAKNDDEMDLVLSRLESLKRTPSRTETSASRYPESDQIPRIMPSQPYCEEAKDATSKPCAKVASVGSAKDHESTSTSRSSSISSSASTQESGSPSSSSSTYHSYGTDDTYDSDESKPIHEKVDGSAKGKQPEFAECISGYDDDNSSYHNRKEDYSDVSVPSSPVSSVRAPKWDLQKQRGKKARGKIRRFGKKIGMIFHHHHHHHHHHHYDDEDDPDVHHARSIWKRFGEMFHHTRKADHHPRLENKNPKKPDSEKPKRIVAEKVRKPEASNAGKSKMKALVKKKDQVRQFQTLVGGLMKHMKHAKKTKQVKNGIKKLEAGHSGVKKEGKKLHWWPKFKGKRSGVKVPNKGKAKFQKFYRTKSLAAAQKILGKKKN